MGKYGEVWKYQAIGKYGDMEVGNVGSGVSRPPSLSRPRPRQLSQPRPHQSTLSLSLSTSNGLHTN